MIFTHAIPPLCLSVSLSLCLSVSLSLCLSVSLSLCLVARRYGSGRARVVANIHRTDDPSDWIPLSPATEPSETDWIPLSPASETEPSETETDWIPLAAPSVSDKDTIGHFRGWGTPPRGSRTGVGRDKGAISTGK
jgi:hypothetical protein